jgi:GNAT acetyltransferase
VSVLFTAALQLETLFELDHNRRILSTREPSPHPGPTFSLIRTATDRAWAVRADVPADVAEQLALLAEEERPLSDLQVAPIHADRYLSLLPGVITSGPAFAFPEFLPESAGITAIEDVRLLQRSFPGWLDDELPERSPVMAVIRSDQVVSVCFCARRSQAAAEAGVETSAPFRGQGLALRVTTAWALAVRNSGRLPIYSTSWGNQSSLAVAHKLKLKACASDWSVSDER